MTIQIPFLPLMGAVALVALAIGKGSSTISVSTALQVLLLGATFLHVLYYSWIYPFYISPLRLVPTVPGFPLWGQFFTIITTECGVPAREWHQKYGPVVRYFFPFGSERLSIAGDDAIKQMTVRNPYNYPKPERARLWMMPVLGEGKLTSKSDFFAPLTRPQASFSRKVKPMSSNAKLSPRPSPSLPSDL